MPVAEEIKRELASAKFSVALWLQRKLYRLHKAGFTGSLTLHYSRGGIGAVESKMQEGAAELAAELGAR